MQHGTQLYRSSGRPDNSNGATYNEKTDKRSCSAMQEFVQEFCRADARHRRSAICRHWQ
jgi:hypothetical protein